MARLLPSVRIVFITRDPVARLHSSYWQACSATAPNGNNNKRKKGCSVEDFEAKVWRLVRNDHSEELDTEFKRAAEHGMYERTLRPWFERFPHRNQILLVDQHHFKHLPQGVVFAVESLVGNRGPKHHSYNPIWKDGYWTLGDYSKATHPSHDREPSKEVTAALERWYRPHVLAFYAMLREFRDVVALGAVGDSFPVSIRQLHPQLFRKGANHNMFTLPPWILAALRAEGRAPEEEDL